MSPWFREYLSMIQDPAHWLFEVTVQIVLDLVIIYFGYQILWKRIILPKLRRDIHAEIDREHDLTHEKEGHDETGEAQGMASGLQPATTRD